MSQGPENTFIKSVHAHLDQCVYWMKNHNEYNGGIADCWYSGIAADLWIEYKFVEMPKRPTTMIDLLRQSSPKSKPLMTQLQKDWITGRRAENREVWVIVGHKDGGALFTGDDFLAPFSADTYAKWSFDRKTLANSINTFCLRGVRA